MSEKTVEQQLEDASSLIEKMNDKLESETSRADKAEAEVKALKSVAKKKGFEKQLAVEPDCFGDYPKKSGDVTKKCRICRFAQKCKVK